MTQPYFQAFVAIHAPALVCAQSPSAEVSVDFLLLKSIVVPS
jgi:hypothetical protein